MSENERIQPERTSIPPLQQGYWVAGILSFIFVAISYLGAVLPILPSGINVPLLVGAATVFILVSLILSYLNAREQNLKTILYEIRRFSSSQSSDYLKIISGMLSVERIEETAKGILIKSAKRVSLVRHAYRIALIEGQPKVAEDLMLEIEWGGKFQQEILNMISQFGEEKRTEIDSISKQILEGVQLFRESELIQGLEEKTASLNNIEEKLRSLEEILKEFG